MKNMEEYANKYDRPDLDRLGLFIEMPYIGQTGKIKKKKTKELKIQRVPRQLLAGCPKSKCGNQDGYFQEDFIRIFNGERPKYKKKKKIVVKPVIPFIPAGPGKLHSTPDDYFGCFYEDVPERFDPRQRGKKKIKTGTKRQPQKLLRPNPMTNPVKKGGPGYVNITLNPYPEHIGERPPKRKKRDRKKKVQGPAPMYSNFAPMEYFTSNPFYDPNDDPPKKATYLRPSNKNKAPPMYNNVFIPTGPAESQGGSHAGCFTPWPEHMKDPFLSPNQILNFVKKQKRGEKPAPKLKFQPYIPPNLTVKTMQTTSVLYTTNYRVVSDNWRTYTPTFVTNL